MLCFMGGFFVLFVLVWNLVLWLSLQESLCIYPRPNFRIKPQYKCIYGWKLLWLSLRSPFKRHQLLHSTAFYIPPKKPNIELDPLEALRSSYWCHPKPLVGLHFKMALGTSCLSSCSLFIQQITFSMTAPNCKFSHIQQPFLKKANWY